MKGIKRQVIKGTHYDKMRMKLKMEFWSTQIQVENKKFQPGIIILLLFFLLFSTKQGNFSLDLKKNTNNTNIWNWPEVIWFLNMNDASLVFTVLSVCWTYYHIVIIMLKYSKQLNISWKFNLKI